MYDEKRLRGIESASRREGREEARKEIARRMLSAGLPLEQVSEFTGLSADILSAL